MNNIIDMLQPYEISLMVIKDKNLEEKTNNISDVNGKLDVNCIYINNVPKNNSYYWFYYICKYKLSVTYLELGSSI